MASNVAMAQIAQPYAQALMSVAQGNNITDQIGEDVRGLLNLLKESDQLRNFIDNPFIDANDNKVANVNMLWDNVIISFQVNTMPEEFLKKFAKTLE